MRMGKFLGRYFKKVWKQFLFALSSGSFSHVYYVFLLMQTLQKHPPSLKWRSIYLLLND